MAVIDFISTFFISSTYLIKYECESQCDTTKLDEDTFTLYFQLSTIDFSHKIFSGPSEHLPAMNRIKTLVGSYNFSSKVFAVGHLYARCEYFAKN